MRGRQNGRECGHAFERRVGMPKLVRLVAQCDARVGRHRLAVRPDGREDHEMRASALRRSRRYFERAEATREGDLRFIGNLLIAKEEDRVLFEGGAHRPVSGIVRPHRQESRRAARPQSPGLTERRPCAPPGWTNEIFSEKPACSKRRECARSQQRATLALRCRASRACCLSR